MNRKISLPKSQFSLLVRNFQFRELFNAMGWDNFNEKQNVEISDSVYQLQGIAEKSGFKIFSCVSLMGLPIPDKALRKKIETKVTILFQEHLIIFTDSSKKEQIWQLAQRKAGSPTKISETRYSIEQDPELLYQRASGLFFTLDEEDKITILDVTKRVSENFHQNNEKVTKKFYESFKKHHSAFLKHIKGIDHSDKTDWYASLMLNRLMFCYFIQKKGFLDNNRNYLQDKLIECKTKKGNNTFYSFYRNFLLSLFHEGLGSPQDSYSSEVNIGKVPYLNGGLFDEHEIEKLYDDIQIDDEAFGKLFSFFDEYEWHLDTRIDASGKDVNPDVIGYIFEKYINDRAQMGAYYTKEDITDYISKNCIIPWLFDEVERRYPKAFVANAWIWTMLKESKDEYIYDAVKKGIPENLDQFSSVASSDNPLFSDMSYEIKKGFDLELEEKTVDGNGPWLWEMRKDWNKPAPDNIALPTEIYREVINRRKRYAEIRSKIENGEIKGINAFITYNLNIRQFAQDVIQNIEDPEFINHFYQALSAITILDPTCGSGAFLFAAMNILEPLYEACIQRMQSFVLDAPKGKHRNFEKVLKLINNPEHPNLSYFIYKSIILNNLYGVDIMKEAVEIAKLRLFLKLVATIETDYRKPNMGLEPLPDIDFNIRAGNTLVGFATEKELNYAIQISMYFEKAKESIKEKCDIVARAFSRYKEIQLQGNTDYKDFQSAKESLNQRLTDLRIELDRLLHKKYYAGKEYYQWVESHQPFHWFAEFYEIINEKGGFDVIIGNPPYVEYSKVKAIYSISNFITEKSGNLYAFIIERVTLLNNYYGRFSFIVLMALLTTKRMEVVRKLLIEEYGFCCFINLAGDWHPGRLFDGVRSQFTIVVSSKAIKENPSIFTTDYLRWNNNERDCLFTTKLSFVKNSHCTSNDSYPKFSQKEEINISKKLFINNNSLLTYSLPAGSNEIYYRNAGIAYYQVAISFKQKFFINNRQDTSSTLVSWFCDTKEISEVIVAIMNSNLFAWLFFCYSDCYHLTKNDIARFKIHTSVMSNNNLMKLSLELMKNIDLTSALKTTNYKTKGVIVYQEFYPRLSKHIIDQIDSLLAQHYQFNQNELDFIINYDIKYRMGKESENSEELERL